MTKTIEDLRTMPGVTVADNRHILVHLSSLPNWYGMVDRELSESGIPCLLCDTEVEVHYPRARHVGITTPRVAEDAYIIPKEAEIEIGHRYFEFRCPCCGLVQLWENYDTPIKPEQLGWPRKQNGSTGDREEKRCPFCGDLLSTDESRERGACASCYDYEVCPPDSAGDVEE